MRALVYTDPERMELREVPDPAPREGEVLVRIAASGICGSDMHAYLGHDERRPAPLILGHEAAGRVMGGKRDGERVTINPLVTCGTCPACLAGRDNLCPDRQIISMPPRDGAFAEAVAIPEENLVALPEGLPFERAALAEPVACGWHAVRLAFAAAGATVPVLVIGGGAIGVGAALSAWAQGAEQVALVEPHGDRRRYVRHAIGLDAMEESELPDHAFPVVIDGVGVGATRRLASTRAMPGGVIAHIGLGDGGAGLDVRRLTLQELTLLGSYTYTKADFRATVAAMVEGRLGGLDWIEWRPLSEGAAAFADIRAGRVVPPKVMLDPAG